MSTAEGKPNSAFGAELTADEMAREARVSARTIERAKVVEARGTVRAKRRN